MTRILIVDDETAIVRLLQELLAEEGYETLTASDGREALQQVQEARPDVVLSDVMMPFVNGLELARAIAENPAYRTIPVVLMTAGGRAVVAEGTPHAAVVAKPFELEQLLGTLQHLLAPPA